MADMYTCSSQYCAELARRRAGRGIDIPYSLFPCLSKLRYVDDEGVLASVCRQILNWYPNDSAIFASLDYLCCACVSSVAGICTADFGPECLSRWQKLNVVQTPQARFWLSNCLGQTEGVFCNALRLQTTPYGQMGKWVADVIGGAEHALLASVTGGLKAIQGLFSGGNAERGATELTLFLIFLGAVIGAERAVKLFQLTVSTLRALGARAIGALRYVGLGFSAPSLSVSIPILTAIVTILVGSYFGFENELKNCILYAPLWMYYLAWRRPDIDLESFADALGDVEQKVRVAESLSTDELSRTAYRLYRQAINETRQRIESAVQSPVSDSEKRLLVAGYLQRLAMSVASADAKDKGEEHEDRKQIAETTRQKQSNPVLAGFDALIHSIPFAGFVLGGLAVWGLFELVKFVYDKSGADSVRFEDDDF